MTKEPTAHDWMDAARIAKAWGSDARMHEFVAKARQAHREALVRRKPDPIKTENTMTPAEALREAARQMEHECEFNVNRTLRWSAARQAENNRRIAQSRELHARADALEKASGGLSPHGTSINA